jgi:hypothetical protein
MLRPLHRTTLIALTGVLALAAIASWGTVPTAGGPHDGAPVIAAPVRLADAARQALAQELRIRLATEGGCTLDPRTARPVGPLDAFAVSRAEHELRLAALPTVDQIRKYLARHEAVLAGGEVYVGAWRDDATGAYYLDLTEVITDRATAEARGREQQQRCIYHLATGCEIRLWLLGRGTAILAVRARARRPCHDH